MYEISVKQKVKEREYASDCIHGEFESLNMEAVVFIETMLRTFPDVEVSIKLKEDE